MTTARLKVRQIAYAGTLYRHACVAAMDTGGTDTDDEAAVVTHAVMAARRELLTMGYHWTECLSLAKCMRIAGARFHGRAK